MRKRVLALAAAATTLAVASPAYAAHRNHVDQDRDYRRHGHYRFYNGDHYGYRYRTWPAVRMTVPRPIPFGAAWAAPWLDGEMSDPNATVPRPIPYGAAWAAPWLNGLYSSAAPYFDYEKSDSGFLLF